MRTKVGYPNERFYLPIYPSEGRDVIDTIDTDPTLPPLKDCLTPTSPPASPPLLMQPQQQQHQPQQAPIFASHYSMPAVVQQHQQQQQLQQQPPQMPTLPTGGSSGHISSGQLTASQEHHDHGGPNNGNSNATIGNATHQALLNNEEARRKTFTAAWPHRFLDTQLLAQTGFYYIGPGDNVKCHFCKVEIGRWETNDHEVTEHQRWSQNCPLLKRRQTTNVPLDAAQLDRVLPAVTIDVCGPGGIDVRHNTVSEGSFDVYPSMAAVPAVPAATHAAQISPGHDQGPDLQPFGALPPMAQQQQQQFVQRQQQFQPLQQQQQQQQLPAQQQFASISVQTAPPSMRPDHPEYAIESARLRSFDDWPKTMKQKPKELSDAGFFYTMKGDRVKCFSCGGGLRDWDENDVPWEQHAQWFGHCQYLQLIKGPEYVEEVLRAAAAAKDAAEQQQLGGGVGADDQTQATATANGAANVGGLALGGGSRVAAAAAALSAEAEAAGAADDATGAGGRKICDSKLCKICYSCEYNTAFWPCGHVVACAKCASSVTKCPMCRKPYERVMRVYFS